MRWASSVLFVWTLGCAGQEVCLIDEAPPETKATLQGMFSLGELDGETHRFTAHLRGIPELWATERPLDAWARLSVVAGYVDPALAAGGPIELPRLSVGLATSNGRNEKTTQRLAPRAVLDLELFVSASGFDTICQAGVPDCEQELWFAVERVEGAPFPAVAVSWTLEASATVNTCPLKNVEPKLQLVKQ